jgi:DNA-binding transcriptional LysR family regulator
MNEIDYLGLDGNTLRTFLTVLEEGSVSIAAKRLGVSQSAVSHTIDRLRTVFDDPLFVRLGRGIQPTARAKSLGPHIETLLDGLKALTFQREFDPKVDSMEFTIATNDFPLQLIFPNLLKKLTAEGVNTQIRFIPSGVPSMGSLRTSRCQMLITPAPPNEPDIVRFELLKSKMVCFYDSTIRNPPKSWKQFVHSKYVEVRFSDTESSMMVLPSIDTSTLNPPTITVPNFSALSSFIKDSDLITTQIEVMSLGLLKDLDFAPLPLKTDPLILYLVWHQRDQDDPAHQWFRQRIIETVNSIIEK